MKTAILSLAVVAPIVVFAQAQAQAETETETETSLATSTTITGLIAITTDSNKTSSTTTTSTNDTVTDTITAAPTTTVTFSSITVSASYANPTCAADYIVDGCLSITTRKQLECDGADYQCQCKAYQAIETCFDNCPKDPRQGSFFPLIAQYCDIAGLATTKDGPRPTATWTGRPKDGEETDTETPSSRPTDHPSPNGGAHLVNCASGMMAAAGLVAALL